MSQLWPWVKVTQYIFPDLYFLCSTYVRFSSNAFDVRSKSQCGDGGRECGRGNELKSAIQLYTRVSMIHTRRKVTDENEQGEIQSDDHGPQRSFFHWHWKVILWQICPHCPHWQHQGLSCGQHLVQTVSTKFPLWQSICLWYRADSRLAPSQWETSLQSNAVSHWLGANLESALRYTAPVCISLSGGVPLMSVPPCLWACHRPIYHGRGEVHVSACVNVVYYHEEGISLNVWLTMRSMNK